MQPRLVLISGPLDQNVIELVEAETSIGREPTNAVSIDDHSISRYHCCITKTDGEFHIEDRKSLNGTFINDAAVSRHPLAHGDRIRIGSVQFVFLIGEDDIAKVAPAPADDLDLANYDTVVLKQDEAVYLSGDSTTKLSLPPERMIADLSALFRISHTINVIRGSEDLQRRLLDLIFEVIPATRGAVLLAGNREGAFISQICKQRTPEPASVFQVSRTVTRQVLRDGLSMMSNDVLQDRQLFNTQSLVASKVRSLLCVPLKIYESALGVIYLDSSDSNIGFDGGHLQLLTAIAAIAAVALEHAQYVEWLEGENLRLQQEIKIEPAMVGESRAMQQLLQMIARVAPRESTVLISGESGTGKELVARAIHNNSVRRDKPFIAINCAAISDHLLESELFGHEKGAFTDARVQKKGKIEIADGGTVFLDEIGELAPRLQAKLLRVLQEREFSRVGGTDSIKVDIRLVAATNRDLENAIKDGTLRQDLYFRLNVVSITTPPLRQHREDIPLLAAHFLKKYSKKCNRDVFGISREALRLLQNYDWPGNVRELENAIERAVVLGQTERIVPEDLPEFLIERNQPPSVTATKYNEAVRQLKKQLILNAVEQTNGTYVKAAKLLGLHPNYLHRLIREMGLKEDLNRR